MFLRDFNQEQSHDFWYGKLVNQYVFISQIVDMFSHTNSTADALNIQLISIISNLQKKKFEIDLTMSSLNQIKDQIL